MPQWAGSCWYYLRYLDARNPTAFVSKDAQNYWMGSLSTINYQLSTKSTTPGVDLYVGGTEHARLASALRAFLAQGFVRPSATSRLLSHFINSSIKVSFLAKTGRRCPNRVATSVNPDVVMGEYGADAFRLYEMFMGPLQDSKPWNTKGVEGRLSFSRPCLAFICR